MTNQSEGWKIRSAPPRKFNQPQTLEILKLWLVVQI